MIPGIATGTYIQIGHTGQTPVLLHRCYYTMLSNLTWWSGQPKAKGLSTPILSTSTKSAFMTIGQIDARYGVWGLASDSLVVFNWRPKSRQHEIPTGPLLTMAARGNGPISTPEAPVPRFMKHAERIYSDLAMLHYETSRNDPVNPKWVNDGDNYMILVRIQIK